MAARVEILQKNQSAPHARSEQSVPAEAVHDLFNYRKRGCLMWRVSKVKTVVLRSSPFGLSWPVVQSMERSPRDEASGSCPEAEGREGDSAAWGQGLRRAAPQVKV